MEPLKCKVCGGSLIMDSSNNFARCEYCETKYSLESLQQMVQALKNVELKVKGIANIDTQLNRAETFIRLGEKAKAIEILKEITNEYPSDYRGWWILAKVLYMGEQEIPQDELSSSNEFKYALMLAPENKKHALLHTQSEFSQRIKKLRSETDQHFQAICSKEYTILEDKIWMRFRWQSAYFSVDGELYMMECRSYNKDGEYFFDVDRLIVDGINGASLKLHHSERKHFEITIFELSHEHMTILNNYTDEPSLVRVEAIELASADSKTVALLNDAKIKVKQMVDNGNVNAWHICSYKK